MGRKVPGPEATFVTPTELRAVFDPNFRTPLLTSWSKNIERQLGSDWVARLGYVGNKGTWFFAAAENSRELNPAIYLPGESTISNTQARRPYQSFSNIGFYESGTNTNYHSIVANLEKRFSHGLTVLANYTWSKKMDGYGWTNPYDRGFDYGLSREDVTHNLKFSNVWQVSTMQMPKGLSAILNGWRLNSLVTWQSGFPYSVTSGRDNSLTGINGDRTDYTGCDGHAFSTRTSDSWRTIASRSDTTFSSGLSISTSSTTSTSTCRTRIFRLERSSDGSPPRFDPRILQFSLKFLF